MSRASLRTKSTLPESGQELGVTQLNLACRTAVQILDAAKRDSENVLAAANAQASQIIAETEDQAKSADESRQLQLICERDQCRQMVLGDLNQEITEIVLLLLDELLPGLAREKSETLAHRISRAVTYLTHQSPIRLLLHPDDRNLLKKEFIEIQIREAGIKVEFSQAIQPGSATLRTPRGDVSISTDGHWQLLRSYLCKQSFPLLQLKKTSSNT